MSVSVTRAGIAKHGTSFLAGVAIALAFGFSVSYLYAQWTPPTAPPPGNNVAAPLNIGAAFQEKVGSLMVNSLGGANSIGLAVPQGSLLFGAGPVSVTAANENLKIDVDGPIGASAYCDENGQNCSDLQGIQLPFCQEGQILMVKEGMWTCGDMVPGTPPVMTELWFGGMYGYKDGGNYPNPLNGNKLSCPPNYKSTKVLGTNKEDHALYFCWADPTKASSTKIALFGGVYSSNYKNPVTLAKNCPAGFTTKQTLGSSGLDYNVYFCYTTTLTTAPVVKAFSGMWGRQGTGGSGSNLYPNPLTGGTCKVPAVTGTVLGTYDVDWPLAICYEEL